MSTEVLERRFAAMGARLRVIGGTAHRVPWIDVRIDRRGEVFELAPAPGESPVEFEVVDVRREDRHLLLLARDGGQKSKFLCGHDERHWFVAAIPESARGVTGVMTAKQALQPVGVRAAVERRRPKDRFRRRNSAYLRQGEWFFVPAPGLEPDPWRVLQDEPLSRGRGKAHLMELAYREGGQLVYVSRGYPTGLPVSRYVALSETKRSRHAPWTQMVRDAAVYACGAVRHPDHATLVLPGWHRVLMNTEQGAAAMRHVAFLD